MALSTRNEIRAQIIEERDYFEADSDRAISELANSLTPIYNGDILEEWRDLPMSESDRWQEMGVKEDATIIERMTTDLALYYRDAVESVLAELRDEWHTCEKPETVSIESARFTGAAVATCSSCAFVSTYWECGCDLDHICTETENA